MTDIPLPTSLNNPDKPPTVVCTTQDNPSVLTSRTGSSLAHSGTKTAVILLYSVLKPKSDKVRQTDCRAEI